MFSSFTIFVTALVDILPESCCPKPNTALPLQPNKAGLTCFTWHFIRKNVGVFPQHPCIIDACLTCGPFYMLDHFLEDIFTSYSSTYNYKGLFLNEQQGFTLIGLHPVPHGVEISLNTHPAIQRICKVSMHHFHTTIDKSSKQHRSQDMRWGKNFE